MRLLLEVLSDIDLEFSPTRPLPHPLAYAMRGKFKLPLSGLEDWGLGD